ncbi:hypothetical protein LRR72_20820, partial [Klebsiella pneumoniae]|nr:hypothetical protein [Klebsiella pneumoniae]
MAFNPPLGSSSPEVLLDNAKRLDELTNGPAATVPDRAGEPLDSWRKMQEDNAALVDETRQNLIPLSRQYMTLADAQADIANIPVGSTTYYRSPDDSALAIEVMNVGGTLQPTGRKMPSQQAVDDIEEQTRQATDGLQRIYLGQQSQATAISGTVDKLDATETALQHIYLGQQNQTTAISGTVDKLDATETALQHIYLGQQNQTTAISDTVDKLDATETALQHIYLGQQNQTTAISDTVDKLDATETTLQRIYLGQQVQTATLSVGLSALDGFDPDAISVEARETYSDQYTFP